MLKPPRLDRERQMVPGLFKPLAQVSKSRIGKDLGLTKVYYGTKVVSYAVAGVMWEKSSNHKYCISENSGGEEPCYPGVDLKSVRHSICHTYLGERFIFDNFNIT
jgi:hypothetical protein